jgi:peptidoglycan-N-acetylglucosamine deacetylase
MRNPRIVTTSWDDGAPKDLRVAELLRSKGVTGTFYVPTRAYDGLTLLTGRDLRSLRSDGLEIGAHSVSHRNLANLTEAELDREVQDCKSTLEQALGEPVRMFCYPNGRYNMSVIQRVRKAGYEGARTTRMLCITTDFQPFEMPTSVQAYPHRKAAYIRNLARAKRISSLVKYLASGWRSRTWVEMAMGMFDRVLKHGGVWHLYGHSWEIDQLGLWPDLTELLNYVSHRDEVIYATNSELLRLAA